MTFSVKAGGVNLGGLCAFIQMNRDLKKHQSRYFVLGVILSVALPVLGWSQCGW
jgi:hypothetical protein